MEQLIRTKFTERFRIDHPIMLAPMDLVSGGQLAAAVSRAGGLGVIGGGYGNADWLEQAFADAGNQAVGVGFITWSLSKQPELVDLVLAHNPAAFMVSFGDGEAAVAKAGAQGIPTVWQIQTLEHARQALAAEVDVIVVQGQEAGGHGMDRGLTALLPAVRDLCGPDQIILAAGGIADGRGLASALMLGADGVMMGTRFWASVEASGPQAAKEAVAAASGDNTIRSKVFDVVRGLDWPWHFTGRVISNEFAQRWHHDIEGLQRDAESERSRYLAAEPNDYSMRVVIAGESVDLIRGIDSAQTIIDRTVTQSAQLLRNAASYVV